MGEVTLLTVSFRGDVERFRFLRESLVATGTSMRHIVVVHTEDYREFEQVCDADVELLPTSKVLPEELEHRRIRSYRRRDPRYWLTARTLPGWLAQQFTKLAAVAGLCEQAAVIVDSDAFLLRRIAAEDFLSRDGRSYLYSSPVEDAMTAAWSLRSMDFLGIDRRDRILRQYVHEPTVLDVETTRRMLAHIEDRYRSKWWRAMEDHDVYEYSTYGTFAEHVAGPEAVCAITPNATLKYWSDRDFQGIAGFIEEIGRHPDARFGGVQSTFQFPVDAYADAVRALWSRG